MAANNTDQSPKQGEETTQSEQTPNIEEIELSEDAAQVVEQLQRERDEAVEARKRALADFRNFQRRAAENEQRALQKGATSIVRSLLPVLDHFDLALSQDASQMNVEQLIGGMQLVRDELHRALQSQDVQRIEPQVGEEFDPNNHEAMTRQPTSEYEPNTVVQVMQSGYRMGQHVLRPAKVAVAAAPEPDDQSYDDEGGEAEA